MSIRKDNLQIITEAFETIDNLDELNDEYLGQELPQYLTLARSGEELIVDLHGSEDEASGWLSGLITGESEYVPYMLCDLDTGESFDLEVSVHATRVAGDHIANIKGKRFPTPFRMVDSDE